VLSGYISDDFPDGRSISNFSGRMAMSSQQRMNGLFWFSPLPPCPGEIGKQAAAAFRGGELPWVKSAAHVYRGPGIAQGPVHADSVETDMSCGDAERLALP
jgi:hypothetical protein